MTETDLGVSVLSNSALLCSAQLCNIPALLKEQRLQAYSPREEGRGKESRRERGRERGRKFHKQLHMTNSAVLRKIRVNTNIYFMN
jgi:hypothetical protein